MPGNCPRCGNRVYHAEEKKANNSSYHKGCFTCRVCGKNLDSVNLAEHGNEIFCKICYGRTYGPRGYGFCMGAGGVMSMTMTNIVEEESSDTSSLNERSRGLPLSGGGYTVEKPAVGRQNSEAYYTLSDPRGRTNGSQCGPIRPNSAAKTSGFENIARCLSTTSSRSSRNRIGNLPTSCVLQHTQPYDGIRTSNVPSMTEAYLQPRMHPHKDPSNMMPPNIIGTSGNGSPDIDMAVSGGLRPFVPGKISANQQREIFEDKLGRPPTSDDYCLGCGALKRLDGCQPWCEA